MAQSAKQAKLSAGETLSRANNGFATDIYKALLPDKSTDNLIFSPFSLHSVLGMVSQGARGVTKTELINGLKFQKEDNDQIVKSSYNFVINSFQKEEDGDGDATNDGDHPWIIRTANRVYSKSGFELNKAFMKNLEENFLANLEKLDLSSESKCAEAAGTINRWVAAKTKNKIQNLVSGDSLNSEDTSLVLVNCIYFKGKWEDEFRAQDTCKGDFFVTAKKIVEVDMMLKNAMLPYGDLPELDAHVVELAYKESRLGMWIILPKAVDGLAKIQNGIGTLRQNGRNVVEEAMDKFQEEHPDYEVQLALPKFTIEATLDNLKGSLENLGMKTMFSRTDANFGGIPDGVNVPPLFISQVVQKAFISVGEKGTEAAAATIAMLLCGSTINPGRTIVEFEVDHPFYFEIVDHDNDDLVLFSGHCNDPSQ